MKQPTLCICLLLSIIALASSSAEPRQDTTRKADTEQAPSAADQEAFATAYLIVAEGDVNGRLAGRVRRGLENAAEGAAQVVIVEIDTFGGRLDAAVEIAVNGAAVAPEALFDRLWDAAREQGRRRLPRPAGGKFSFEDLSGRRLGQAVDHENRVWDLMSGELLAAVRD